GDALPGFACFSDANTRRQRHYRRLSRWLCASDPEHRSRLLWSTLRQAAEAKAGRTHRIFLGGTRQTVDGAFNSLAGRIRCTATGPARKRYTIIAARCADSLLSGPTGSPPRLRAFTFWP